MIEEAAAMEQNIPDNAKKRNIQAMLGLLKIKSINNQQDYRTLRIQKNEFQKSVLKDVFKLTRFPSKQTREDLALLLNHTNRGIQIWFQNQRNSREEKEARHNTAIAASTGVTRPDGAAASATAGTAPGTADGEERLKSEPSLPSSPSDGSKKGIVDLLTLVDIIERNMSGDKRFHWEGFINYTPQLY